MRFDQCMMFNISYDRLPSGPVRGPAIPAADVTEASLIPCQSWPVSVGAATNRTYQYNETRFVDSAVSDVSMGSVSDVGQSVM